MPDDDQPMANLHWLEMRLADATAVRTMEFRQRASSMTSAS
jgi:hypothetical protein